MKFLKLWPDQPSRVDCARAGKKPNNSFRVLFNSVLVKMEPFSWRQR